MKNKPPSLDFTRCVLSPDTSLEQAFVAMYVMLHSYFPQRQALASLSLV